MTGDEALLDEGGDGLRDFHLAEGDAFAEFVEEVDLFLGDALVAHHDGDEVIEHGFAKTRVDVDHLCNRLVENFRNISIGNFLKELTRENLQ